MVPAGFDNFFLAMAGAGGALIGLLFVAISIDPERTFGAGGNRGRQRVASGAYMALVNGFFISMSGLLPHANVGDVAIPVSIVGLFSSAALGRDLVRHQWHLNRSAPERWRGMGHALLIVGVNLALYGYEAVLGAQLLQHPRDPAILFSLSGILLGVYAVGLARAWQLLGAPGSLLRWLDPLRYLTDADTLPDVHLAESDDVAGRPGNPARREVDRIP